ncbi:MAG: hypothetical protein JWM25_475 [Thermoleophilia bacterium]|nr:hypothetical protein [Thermoleophilia bacterium]MCZ4495892.1 hypothetical protein [Thermoleophilia bacterium]
MVEFALMIPVLFLVLLAIMQLGYLYGRQLDLKSATRDGARRASVSMDRTDPVLLTRRGVLDSLALTKDTDVSITVTPAPPWNHGDRVTVQTTTPHAFNIMGIAVWSGQLRAESEIRVE